MDADGGLDALSDLRQRIAQHGLKIDIGAADMIANDTACDLQRKLHHFVASIFEQFIPQGIEARGCGDEGC